MAEFIERKSLIAWLHNMAVSPTLIAAIENKERFPTADVVEVVHGHNATSMHPVDEFLCSVCGFCCADYSETKYDEDGDYEYSCECEFDYCPKCGAKMDGENNE